MKRKIQRKSSKEVKKLLIALLIGDGTISNNYVFKLSHSTDQLEFLKWKIEQLNALGIKNNGIKDYISTSGYNKGLGVLYSQLSVTSLIKALRKSVYIPKKKITRNLLNWLDPKGVAIWYMDDGCINISNHNRDIRIATCVDEETVNIIITYFKEQWNINFIKFKEGKGTFSITTTNPVDTENFIKLVRPYVEQVPSLLYKLREEGTKKDWILEYNSSEAQGTQN